MVAFREWSFGEWSFGEWLFGEWSPSEIGCSEIGCSEIGCSENGRSENGRSENGRCTDFLCTVLHDLPQEFNANSNIENFERQVYQYTKHVFAKKRNTQTIFKTILKIFHFVFLVKKLKKKTHNLVRIFRSRRQDIKHAGART
jgi:hypothetical protein